jgi:hypothetical protein
VFDAKIYKNVGGVFAVSALSAGNKNILTFFIFVFNYHRFWSKIPPNSKLNTQNPKLTVLSCAWDFQFSQPVKATS